MFLLIFFRQIVQYVLDHWSDYRSRRMNMCHDSADTADPGDQYSLQRLQVEVDQFFLRAAYQIISAHRYTVHEGSSFQYVLFYSMFSMKEEGCLHLPPCPSVRNENKKVSNLYTKSKLTNFSQTISFFTMPKKIIKRKLLFTSRI